MSIRIQNTIILKLNPEEYHIILDIRKIKDLLGAMWPGSIVVHLDGSGNINKHEFHLVPKNQKKIILINEGLDFSQEEKMGNTS